MKPGTYVIAGGGFSVCGSSSLLGLNGDPTQVMIYNTKDPDELRR